MVSKEYYKKLFPHLTEYYLVPNSESREYNCISYSLGVTQSGLWPGWFWINECSEVKLSPINLKRVIISLI